VAVLAGRELPLAALEGALADALTGAGRLALITGEAGIGKSRLAEAAADIAAQRDVPVMRGYAVDDEGAPPLWPWLRIARADPDLEHILRHHASADEPAARFQVFVAVAEHLRKTAATRGLVLLLEDVHWADRTSLLLLRHLSLELADSRILVIATFRAGIGGALAAVLPELTRATPTRSIVLTGLEPAAVTGWFADVGFAHGAQTIELLCARTDGNPLLIKMLAEALPAGHQLDPDGLGRILTDRPDVGSLVTGQLETLSTAARTVVVAAAVVAERISPDLLAAVTGIDRVRVNALLAEAVRAGVLFSDPAGLMFRHALVRDAVYTRLLPAQRMELHERAAQALVAVGSPGLAGSIAVHWRKAGNARSFQRATEWAVKAALDAHQRLAFDEEVSFLQLAVECADARDVGPAILAPLTLKLATAAFYANRTGLTIDSCVRAADLAERADLPDVLAAAALVVHGVGAVDVNRVIGDLCRRALDRVPVGDIVTRARLLARLAIITVDEGGDPSARKLAAEALALAESGGHDLAILEAIAARHLTIAMIETVHERMLLANRAIDLGARFRSPMAALWGHLWRLEASLQMGDLADVDRELASINWIAVHRHSAIARWHHHRLLATRCALVGDFPAALEHNSTARVLAEKMDDGATRVMFYAFVCLIAVVRGTPPAAALDMVEFVRSIPPIPIARISAPIILALKGDRSAALAAFEEFRELPGTLARGPRWAGTITQIGIAAVLLHDVQVAGEVYSLLLPFAKYCTGDGSGAVICFGSNALQLGDLALTVGRCDEALRHYADAVAVNSRLGHGRFSP